MPLSGPPRSPPSGCGLHPTFNSCPVRVPFGPTETDVCTTPWPLDTLHPAEPGPAFPGHQRSYGSDLFRGPRDDACLQVGRQPVGWWVVFGCPARRGSHGALGLTLPPYARPGRWLRTCSVWAASTLQWGQMEWPLLQDQGPSPAGTQTKGDTAAQGPDS